MRRSCAATALRAAVVSLPRAGTNDAKGCNWDYKSGVQGKGDLFKNDYAAMIAAFRALPTKPKIYVVLPPPLYPP